MAERKKPGGRKKKADVIDVGDAPAKENADDEEGDSSDEETSEGDDGGLDSDLENAAAVLAAGQEGEADPDVEVPEPKVSTRGGSLARRDPMAAYMSET